MKLSTHRFPEPTQCVLWGAPKRVAGKGRDILETVDTYVEDEHLFRRLLKRRECGQHYFYEMHEEMDWVDGEDPQYRTYIAVSTMAEVEMLRTASTAELRQALPALRSDFPKGVEAPTLYWAGKKE